ncbi:MAG: DUF2244 domain-containing protein [Pseudomonadota bacterium]
MTAAADPYARPDPPGFALTLWPHRSLTSGGAQWVVGLAAGGMALPLASLSGSRVGWGLLPFLVGALYLLYTALRRSYRDGRLREDLRIWPDLITVTRVDPRGRVRRWHANPYWVTAHLHEDAAIESYLTLKGNGREIELGAFLSPEERVALYHDVTRELTRAGTPA